jgi:hypothetical protein
MRFALPFTLLLLSPFIAADDASNPASDPISLAELAARADVVALAQARDTDYFTRRDIPVSGSAYLKVLIPYKADQALDIIEIYEKGLHENECYFPNPTVFEEGRRYLLFLQRDPDDDSRYRGLPEGCALDVLVSSDNRYAVRYPITGIELSDELGALVQDMTFSDSYAITDDESLPPALRDAMLAAGQIEVHEPVQDKASATTENWLPEEGDPGKQWSYTQGISLSAIREIMNTEPTKPGD